MLNHRKFWSSLFLVALGCLFMVGSNLTAGDKKTDDKKKKEAPKATAPLLNKSMELKASDEKDTHADFKSSPRKVFPFKLTEGTMYQIDLKSKDFDAVLRLEDASGKEVAFNDDADINTLDARIVYKATATGDYKIIVTSFDRKAGNFTLIVAEADAKSVATARSKFRGDAIKLELKPLAYTGDLTEKDASAFKHYYKLFTVELEQGKTYRIDMRVLGDASKFDPHLFLEDADGNPLADDDDGGDALNSRIIYKAARTGVYRVIATTSPQMQTGRFTLEVGPNVESKKEKK